MDKFSEMIISRISESFVRTLGIRLWMLFFALCFLYVTNSFAETAYIDRKTGFIFPQSIGVFNFDNKREYDDPRLGYGLNYRSENNILLTVIVYDLGLIDIQDGTDGPKVRAQFNEAKKDIRVAVRQGYYRSVEPLSNLNGLPIRRIVVIVRTIITTLWYTTYKFLVIK